MMDFTPPRTSTIRLIKWYHYHFLTPRVPRLQQHYDEYNDLDRVQRSGTIRDVPTRSHSYKKNGASPSLC